MAWQLLSLLGWCLFQSVWPITLHVSFAEPEGPSPNAEQAWKLYLPLWTALISSESPGAYRGADRDGDVSAWSQPTNDALMSAVLDALRNLELDYQQKLSMDAAAHAGKDVDIKEVKTFLHLPRIPM